MLTRELVIPHAGQSPLTATLVQPPGRAGACVLLVHCLAAERSRIVAGRFADSGLAVLLLDCATPAATGDVSVVLAPQATVAASEWLDGELGLPQVAVGHSLGATLLLSAATGLRRLAALATVNAPRGAEGFTRRASISAHRFTLGAQHITLAPDLLPSLSWDFVRERVEHLRCPLLIAHSPLDNTVDINNAAQIFTAAKHPKSFVSLDGSDHLLSRDASAQHAADIIAAWARRYLPAAPKSGSEVIVEWSGEAPFRQRISAAGHAFIADEPEDVGGGNAGPNPYDLLLAGLGACTAMTLRLYAERKGLPLRHVTVTLKHEKMHAADCQDCQTREGRIDRIERVIRLEGELSTDERARLLDIANKCPVHRTLHAEVSIPTRLADQP